MFFLNKNIAIFGAGKYGKKVLREIEEYNANIVGVVDSDFSKQGTDFSGYIIISPQEMYEMCKNDNIIVVVANHFHLGDMINSLLENEVNDIAIIS